MFTWIVEFKKDGILVVAIEGIKAYTAQFAVYEALTDQEDDFDQIVVLKS